MSKEERADATSISLLHLKALNSFEELIPDHVLFNVKNSNNATEKFLFCGLYHLDEPSGIAIIEKGHVLAESKLLWIFVRPECQRQQFGSRLLTHAFEHLKHENISCCMAEIDEVMEDFDGLKNFFHHLGFDAPEPFCIVCRFDSKKVFKSSWVKDPSFPLGFTTFLWKDLTEAERNWLLSEGLEEMRVPPLLSPFREEHIFQPLNSLGLKLDGKIVGWQINHIVNIDTVRYTTLYVKPEIQASGVAIPLIGRSIQLQYDGRQLWTNRAIFATPHTMKQMSKFVRRRFVPFVDEVSESFTVTKRL